ncbi:hypothetical protein TNCV_5056911 [Trichonephila clavipes]|nr:hypothetical protein TNCV_5056911 [Trichonephila clavipes]
MSPIRLRQNIMANSHRKISRRLPGLESLSEKKGVVLYEHLVTVNETFQEGTQELPNFPGSCRYDPTGPGFSFGAETLSCSRIRLKKMMIRLILKVEYYFRTYSRKNWNVELNLNWLSRDRDKAPIVAEALGAVGPCL